MSRMASQRLQSLFCASGLEACTASLVSFWHPQHAAEKPCCTTLQLRVPTLLICPGVQASEQALFSEISGTAAASAGSAASGLQLAVRRLEAARDVGV